jgi:periplasmic divalent cation tolerance protein
MAKLARGGYVVVLVSCASHSEAKRIARSVVSLRLAACVNIVETPVHSVYRWKGKVNHSREILLLIKSSRRRFFALRREVERLHSYEVPEFLALPVISGSPAYLAWLEESVRPARGA